LAIEVRPSRVEDIALLLGNAPGWLSGACLREMSSSFQDRYATTFLVDGEVAACYGASQPWPGLVEVWAVVHPERVHHCRLTFHRAAKATVADLLADPTLHRLQAYVLRNYEVGRAWVRRLGFEAETIIEAAGPQREDLVVYRILKKG